MCGFVGGVTRYEKFANMNTVHSMYFPFMSRVMSSNWRRGRTGEELKEFGAEVCELTIEVMELFSSLRTSGV